MILVAGLAVAGLAGIAAAFYFSMRPGDSRARASQPAQPSRPGRSADSRHAGSRSRTAQAPSGKSNPAASPAQSGRPARSPGGARSGNGRTADRAGSSTVIDFTGPQQVLEDSEPPAARRSRTELDDSDDMVGTARSRRRVGWRKGSEVDEELWPVEEFGGVSDEQFWDDLASDKPLATTARTAQPEGAVKRRPPNAGPLPDLYTSADRGRGDNAGGRGAGRGGATGTHSQPRLAPDDRTAVQPAMASPVATQPYPMAARPSPSATQSSSFATQPSPTATQLSPVATQPVRAGQQPAEPRRRSRATISADEDPLTSPAYSLRPRGSVDGRAYPSRRSGDQYDAAAGQATQAFSLAEARAAGGGYPDGVPSSRQFDRPSPEANGRGRADGHRSDPLGADPLRSGDGYGGTVASTAYPYPQQSYADPTRSAGTPPYGERDRYGNPAGSRTRGVPAGSADPRRANGGWSSGQATGNGAGDGSWGSRPTYPPANGYRAPYDPRGYDRRLTSLTWPRPRSVRQDRLSERKP